MPAVADVDLTLGARSAASGFSSRHLRSGHRHGCVSRVPRAGSATAAPFFADDNREPTISDDGNLLAFISTRNLVSSVGNADGNPELFFYNIATDAFTQATKTQDAVLGVGATFQSNPSLSADGSTVAFLSSANLATNNADGNAEIFIANFGGGGLSNVRQVTRTLNNTQNANVLSPGRRLSRNGALIAFESRATDPKSNAASSSLLFGTFLYTVATDTFVEIGTRPGLSTWFGFQRSPTTTHRLPFESGVHVVSELPY